MQTAPLIAQPVPATWDRSGLPGWAYHSPAFLALEKAELFATHWQLACHVSDLPEPGAWVSLDIGDDRALVIRGQDGVIRALHNLCRHRGARVAAGDQGQCKNALVCPFHGWVYNLDGTLRGPARPKTFEPDFDRAAHGLKPMESEIWMGFVFVRCRPGPQGSVAETLAPFAADFADYRLDDLVPTGPAWTTEIAVNWKSVRDVDNEGYHVAMAHPGLQDLYGANYRDYISPEGLSWSLAPFSPHGGRRWSVRHYLKILPDQPRLPEDKRRSWGYYGVFPNAVFTMTPEGVQFYQEFPLGTDRTRIRALSYRRPDEDRRQRLARYLAGRIDRETQNEDIQLSIWSNEAMKSSAFDGFHLSDLEWGVRRYHDRLRAVLPVLTCAEAPPEDRLRDVNDRIPDRAQQTPGRPTPGRTAMIHLSRRSTLAVLGGALAAPYVRRAHAADEPVLNIYNWADYIGETTVADFEARTGITVNYDVYASTEEMQAKMLAGMTGYDLVNVAGTDMPRFLDANLLLPLDRARLPDWANLDPEILRIFETWDPGNAHGVPYMWGSVGIAYNMAMVRERLGDIDLSSLDVLMKPENAEKLADCGISMLDSPQDIIPMVLAWLGKDGRAADPADYPAAVEALQQVRPFFATFDNANYINALPNGELCAVASWSGDYATASARAAEAGVDIDLQYFVPATGAPAWADCMSIPADAPHPENAHAFLAYLLEPEVIAACTNYVNYANGNAASKPFVNPEILANPSIYPDAATVKRMWAPLPWTPEQDSAMARAWTEVRTG